ncbi:hypothetical protein W02_24670 [Nitrospira sp. KM1]|uniref:hypothetical protein n=1 Tax=Nitrospira sp. KM1 TaxID=1936990 RepID=UPI0013A775CF|nr:hypothetical protein [Nitrospira sp. KM1]BCA55327.1 hypothetical protein W02_24670 [Nitrospira sp. KM1]
MPIRIILIVLILIGNNVPSAFANTPAHSTVLITDPVTIIAAVAGALTVMGKVAKQIEAWFTGKPEKPSSPVTAEQQSGSILVKENGQIIETITSDELNSLDQRSKMLIRALSKSIDNTYVIWAAVYPYRNDSSDPIVNAKTNKQLNEIANNMCSDLTRLLDYIEGLGKKMPTDYTSVHRVCEEVASRQGS